MASRKLALGGTLKDSDALFKANFLQVKYIKNPEIIFNKIVIKEQIANDMKSISTLESA